MFLIVLLIHTLAFPSELKSSFLESYSTSITSFINNSSNDDSLFILINKDYKEYRDINIFIPMFTQFSPFELKLNKNNITITNNDLDNQSEYFHDKLFMLLCLNSFLSGEFDFIFNEKELIDVYDNSVLNRKLNMLKHFSENYKSFQYGVTDLVRIDNGYFFINKYEDEIILLCLNYFDSNKQYALDLSKYNIDIGLSLLDRSMIKLNAGIAEINLSKYQTKIFNLKR